MTSLKTDPILLIHHLILTPLQDTVSKMIKKIHLVSYMASAFGEHFASP